MKAHLLIATAITGLAITAIPAAAATVSTAEFVREASIGNEFEVESSKLALDKSQNKDIKNFAYTIINDYTKTEEDLRQLLQASAPGLKVDENLDSKHEIIMNRLQKFSTDAFNNNYIAEQIEAHKQAVELFMNYSKNGDDPALKKFAADTLPTLQEDLRKVEKLQEK